MNNNNNKKYDYQNSKSQNTETHVKIDRGPCSLSISLEYLNGDVPLLSLVNQRVREEILKKYTAPKYENYKVFEMQDIPPDHFQCANLVRSIIPDSVTTLADAANLGIFSDPISSLNPVYRFVIGMERDSSPLKLHIIEESISKNQQYPHVLLVSGIHAREWMAQEVLLEFVKSLVHDHEDKHFETEFKNSLVNKFVLWVIPCVNMFGTLSSQAHLITGVECPLSEKTDYLERRATRKDCCDLGIDNNRNFPVAWGFLQEEYKNNPEHECFPGSFPLEKPECKLLMDLVKQLQENLVLIVDIHNCGDMVMKAPIFDEKLAGNTQSKKISQEISRFLDDSSVELLGNEHPHPTKPYSAGGTFSDSCLFGMLIPSFCLEIGNKWDRFESDTPKQEMRKHELVEHLLPQYLCKFVPRASILKHQLQQNCDPAFSV